MQTENNNNQYNFTNSIESIEGGYVEYDEQSDGYANFKSTSFLEKLIKMTLQCANVHHKHLRCAIFSLRTLLEVMVLFSFIGFFSMMILW